MYLVHHMAAEASNEEMGTDTSEDEPAKGGEDFQQDHQDHQALQHLEILVSTLLLRYIQWREDYLHNAIVLQATDFFPW